MKKCFICRKEPAFIYTAKINPLEKEKITIGFCLNCISNLDIPGFNEIINKYYNLDIENFEKMSEVLSKLGLDDINVDESGSINIEKIYKNLMQNIKNSDMSIDEISNLMESKDLLIKGEDIKNFLNDSINDNKEEFTKAVDKVLKNKDLFNDLPDDIAYKVDKNIPIEDITKESEKNEKNPFQEIINDITETLSNFRTQLEKEEDEEDESNEEDDKEKLKDKIKEEKEINKKRKSRKNLEKYAIYLNDKIDNNEIDTIIGREKEINRIISILSRKSKNNPILIGDAGVGKTAVIDGLALKIRNKEVPFLLLNKEIYSLDVTNLVSGTSLRGQFEQRISNIVKEAKKDKNIIIVMDEIHKLIGMGTSGQDTSMDAANILKPALSDGSIQVIGITTKSEYRKYIEKDSALNRRFQPVYIDEPNIEDTIEILQGLKPFYEKFHYIDISDEAIIAAVKLSKRYINDKNLPDKAIDLIDEACANLKIRSNSIKTIKEIEKTINEYSEKKQDAYIANRMDDFNKYQEEEAKLIKYLKDAKEKETRNIIYEDDIAKIIESMTKIPVSKITDSESKKLISLEKNLKSVIIGQDDAIKKISQTIKRNRVGFRKIKKPASFMFVGPTGVGKTQLAKKLAKEIFGSEENMIRIDMSEYAQEFTASRFIGAAPGYVGYNEGNDLVTKVRQNPYSIVLFDEIEKAHSKIFDLFLQILDDGKLTASDGKVAHFENTIVIMTSNAGSNIKSTYIGFNDDDKEENYKEIVKNNLKTHFKPEFLNRIDDIVVFNHLTKENIEQIINIELNEYNNYLKEFNIHCYYDNSVIEYLIKNGYDNEYGARPLKRQIQSIIENKMSDLFIEGKINKGDNLEVKIINNKIDISKKNKKN